NDIRLKEFDDFLHGSAINFKKRLVFSERINREIEGRPISLAAAAFIDVPSPREKVASGFMDGNGADIRIVIKAPLNAISVMGIGIDIHDSGIVLAFQVVDSN